MFLHTTRGEEEPIMLGNENKITVRRSIDTSGGGSAWVCEEVAYTSETPHGRITDNLPIDGFYVRRVVPTVNEKLKEFHGPPQDQFIIQLKGGGIKVGTSDGQYEELWPPAVTRASDVEGCGHTSEPITMEERISLFIPTK